MVKWPKTPPFHGGNSGSNPGRVILFSSIRRSGFSGESLRAFSSVGQSSRLITDRSGVQVPEGPPSWPGSSVGLECQPVTLEVEGSSPFRVATFRVNSLAILEELRAGVAQLAEQLICNQQVAGSSPIASSTLWVKRETYG